MHDLMDSFHCITKQNSNIISHEWINYFKNKSLEYKIEKLREYNTVYQCKSISEIHSILWYDLDLLCKEPINIKGWKYEKELKATILAHQDGQRVFNYLTWEDSFVLDFIYRIGLFFN